MRDDTPNPLDRGSVGRFGGCYREGISVSEASRQTSGFVEGWTRHPAQWKVDQDAVVRRAS